MNFKFYNSYTKKLEDFTPRIQGEVSIYSCGPTVYDLAHIGNFRSYVFSDILRRSLKAGGYKITHVMNITDVDDKTIRRTTEKNSNPGINDLKEYTAKYIEEFFVDLDQLGIERVEYYPAATEHIVPMIALTEKLLNKGYAYKLDDSIYFSINRFAEYGKLSGIDLTTVKSGTRYNTDEYTKEDVRDFVLWKTEKENEKISWDSPFGKGRPGWHLECSAMINEIFKGPIDIHTGGIDLMFPHHENEIAQSVNAYGHDFVKYWLHCEHLLVDGHKMSKSEGNFFTLRDLMNEGYSVLAVRYFLLSSHYRQKLNFTRDVLKQTGQTLKRIYNFMERFNEAIEREISPEIKKSIKDASHKLREDFLNELKDDLNTPRALAVLHEAINFTNSQLDLSGNTLDAESKKELKGLFAIMDSVLNILHFSSNKKNETSSNDAIEHLIQKRDLARKEKNYRLSDEIRSEIENMGFEVLDTPQGTRVKSKSVIF